MVYKGWSELYENVSFTILSLRVGAQNSNFGGDFLRQNTILSQIDGYLYIISTAHTTLSIV